MDIRRAGPVAVAVVVLGFLGWQTMRNRDAKPLEDPESAGGRAPGVAVDRYAASGKNKRLTGEEEAPPSAGAARMPLPEGHPVIPSGAVPDGHPPIGGTTAGAPPAAGDGSDAALPFTFTLPAGWRRTPPASQFRLAQWEIPAEGGGETGEIYFTPSIGGGVEANVARWAKQMHQEKAATRTLTVHGLTVTRVDVSGSYGGMAGPNAPAAPAKDGWRLLGAAVETPSGTYFVKGVGPAAVMAREEAAFDLFLSSFTPR